MLEVLDGELSTLREELIGRVSRLEALSDLKLQAQMHRDRTGNEPTYEGLLDAAKDEMARASLIALSRRITNEEKD